MALLCITEAAKQFDVSSKTLRYYENVGILKSNRMDNNKYRYYNDEVVERIKQILILRKMQISIKDIIRIYKNEDMSTVVEVFVERMNTIDEQVDALSQLKNITNEFLQTMIKKGITKISALPLLYEEMDKQLEVSEEHKPVTYEELSSISEKLEKRPEIRIISLSKMRVITSYNKYNESLIDDFWAWVLLNGINPGSPGAHEQFEYQDDINQSVIILAIPDDYINHSDFCDKTFDGGMFAVASVYADEDLEAFQRAVVRYFDGNPFYEIDYLHSGKPRNETLIETVISPDSTRELIDIFIPVKRRMPEVKNYKNITSIKSLNSITINEIEHENPILWTHKIPLDKLVPVYKKGYESVHHEFLPNGELLFNPYVSTRYLSTDLAVRLPFRFDMEFMIKNRNMRIRHDGNDYTINDNNSSRMVFMQPVFKDLHRIEEAGQIKLNEYNRVSWIIGEKHLALIINEQIRYCGVGFPYMFSDFGLLQEHPILIGSDGDSLTIRSITVSQLKYKPKTKIKKENFNMITKQSNNILPNIRVICRGDRGENHAFPGVAAYVMECIGDTTIGEFKDDVNERLWFFEGLSADVLAPIYSYVGYQGWARSDYLYGREFITDIFNKCGYTCSYITPEEFNSNREMYIQTVMAYIDKGVPIIIRKEPHDECMPIVGYEDYGKTLLYPDVSNTKEIHKLVVGGDMNFSWVFVGEKKREINIAETYMNMICELPEIFDQKSEKYCFGANAFLEWADEIERDKFYEWDVYHINFLTMTAGAGASRVFDKVIVLNPSIEWIKDVKDCYDECLKIWNEGGALMQDFVRKMGHPLEEAIKIIKVNRNEI
jgi:DNA-binding transcriptional MerR regulator